MTQNWFSYVETHQFKGNRYPCFDDFAARARIAGNLQDLRQPGKLDRIDHWCMPFNYVEYNEPMPRFHRKLALDEPRVCLRLANSQRTFLVAVSFSGAQKIL